MRDSGADHFVVDLKLRRAADVALLAPIADRLVSVRLRGRLLTWELGALPTMPCVRSLALRGRVIEGVAELQDRTPRLEALSAQGTLAEEDAVALGSLESLRELRVWPRAADASRFSSVRQITRLYTRAHPEVLRAFEGAPLTRLVLQGHANRAVLRRAAGFSQLTTLDAKINSQLERSRLPELAALPLTTLILDWHRAPPRLPSLPTLRMFVARGELNQESLTWLRRQHALRTVHSTIADAALQSALPRVRAYTIGRPPIDEIPSEEDPALDVLTP